jgi:NADH-quinone oxidoreductase subunit E
MSVRRLAKIQPDSFAFSPETRAKADWWIAKYPEGRQASAVIPLLWLVQKQEGWVSEPAIRAVADLLGMPVIRVFEVATFYTMFMLEPVGKKALIQVCGTTPCMLRGAGELMEVCKRKIGEKDHLSVDGNFTWQEVECLGACVNAPMAQINDYYFEDLTAESMEKIIDDFAAGKSPKAGSYAGRYTSEPTGGALTLTDPKLYDGSLGKKIKTLPNAPVPEKKAKAAKPAEGAAS